MAPKLDLIGWYFSFSPFKQFFTILLLGPLAASIWALIDDWKRPWSAQALVPGSADPLASAGEDQGLRKVA
jgi:hypothetical protein